MLIAALVLAAQSANVAPLVRAHAHNDYAHTRPLLDALDNGFCSIEADVFLVGGKLLVGHGRAELKPERSLDALYLRPLLARLRANKGWVYSKPVPLTLLVDIKADAEGVYAELKRELAPLESWLTRFDGTVRTKAVTVILSGERPTETLRKERSRIAFIDGRMPDLQSNPPASLTPLVSDTFEPFGWNGEGTIPDAVRAEIARQVSLAHSQGRRIRYWATPDTKPAWAALYELGVDLINTDDLSGLRRFLLSRQPEGRGDRSPAGTDTRPARR